jgi:hypothetical protein
MARYIQANELESAQAYGFCDPPKRREDQIPHCKGCGCLMDEVGYCEDCQPGEKI